MQISETKISCPRCKLVNSGDAKYCSKCGYEFNQKRRKTFWLWLLILLLSGFFAILFAPAFFLYLILVLIFARTVRKIFKAMGAGHGWLLGLSAIVPIAGPLIPFFIARHKLKKINGWSDETELKAKQVPLPPNAPEQAPLPPNAPEQVSPPSSPKKTRRFPIFIVIAVIILIIIIIYVVYGGGGTRNCIKRLTGGYFGEAPRPPECSDYDRKLKNTTLNGRPLGKCIALSNDGKCIKPYR